MPGRIHVAVLQWSDLPPPTSPAPTEPSTAFLSLKVAMGRKEYGSVGMGDFSFPVSSLREKLVVMLYNGEANIISKRELNTMSVVEKGNWDVTLPLEGGGNVLLRLQFLLSEEERKKIQDMRNSVKKKWEDTLKGGDNTTSGKYGNSSNTLPSQEVQKFSEVLVSKADETSTVTIEATVKKYSPLDCVRERHDFAEKCPHPLIEHSELLMTRSATESSSGLKDLSHNTTRKSSPDRSSNSTVRKMISAFESGLPQETMLQITKIKSEGSLKRMTFAIDDTEEKEFQQTMSKSFSSGMLSEINAQQNPTFSESLSLEIQDNFTESLYVDFNAFEEKNRLSVLPSSESKDFESRSKVIESEEVLTLGGAAKSVGGENLISISGSKGPVNLSIQKESRKKNFFISLPREGDSYDPNTGSQSSGEVASSFDGSRELQDSGLGSRNSDGNGNLGINSKHYYHSNEANLEIVNQNEDKFEKHRSQEEAQLSRKVIDESFFSDVQAFNSTCSRIHYSEPMNFEISHDITKLIHLNSVNCCFEILGFWIRRHICVTTGHEQLRDLFQHCSLCTYTPRMDRRVFIAETNDKQRMPGDAFDDVKISEDISSSHEDMDDYAGYSILHGWLIGQSVQLVIMIVACGTILLSTR